VTKCCAGVAESADGGTLEAASTCQTQTIPENTCALGLALPYRHPHICGIELFVPSPAAAESSYGPARAWNLLSWHPSAVTRFHPPLEPRIAFAHNQTSGIEKGRSRAIPRRGVRGQVRHYCRSSGTDICTQGRSTRIPGE